MYWLESDRISFSFSVPKTLICAGFGHFRLRPKMMLHFRFRFRFRCKLRTNTEIHSSSDRWPVQTGGQILFTAVSGPRYNGCNLRYITAAATCSHHPLPGSWNWMTDVRVRRPHPAWQPSQPCCCVVAAVKPGSIAHRTATLCTHCTDSLTLTL